MGRRLHYILLFFLLVTLVGCKKEEPMVERTLVFYYPYAANLQSYFRTNIEDMKTAITALGGTPNQRVMVLLSGSENTCTLYEIRYKKGVAELYMCEDYASVNSASVEGFSSIWSDIERHAPASRYSMVIGAHGLGWVPREDVKNAPMRRYFGGLTYATRMNIEDFACCLRKRNIRLEFLLFDCCYMANVELCYELSDVTEYIVATTSELMGPGMPYLRIGAALLGTPDYAQMTQGFLEFYSSYSTPCGTLAVIRSAEMRALAEFTKRMYASHYQDAGYLRSSQVLDGYSPPLFYDYGDYMVHLHLTEGEKAEMDELLRRVVPFAVHTPTYYSAFTYRQYPITYFSGLTTSACSLNAQAVHWSMTSWANEVVN